MLNHSKYDIKSMHGALNLDLKAGLDMSSKLVQNNIQIQTHHL